MKKYFTALIAAIAMILSIASDISTAHAATSLDKLMNTYVGTTWNNYYYGIQCKGFANFIFYKLWDVKHIGAYGQDMYYIPNPSGSYEVGRLNFNTMSRGNAKNLLLKGLPGDFIQVRRRGKSYGHSMILVDTNSRGITVFDCNSDGACGVRKYDITWQQFYNKNSAMSLYRAKNNKGTATNTNTPRNTPPTGYIDDITGGNGQIKVRGWAFDYDDCSKPLDIHVYISKSLGSAKSAIANIKANKKRADVTRVYPSAGNSHGFDQWIDVSETGTYYVYVYAINIGGGSNIELGYRKVNISPKNPYPIGYLDEVTGGNGQVKVRGWAFDYDDCSKPLDIHVYISKTPESKKSAIANVKANKERTDVTRVYPSAGNWHGFDQWIKVREKGTYYIYVYAINIGNGSNIELGYRTVNIS